MKSPKEIVVHGIQTHNLKELLYSFFRMRNESWLLGTQKVRMIYFCVYIYNWLNKCAFKYPEVQLFLPLLFHYFSSCFCFRIGGLSLLFVLLFNTLLTVLNNLCETIRELLQDFK